MMVCPRTACWGNWRLRLRFVCCWLLCLASLKGWHLTHQNEGEDDPYEDLGSHAQVVGIASAKSLSGNQLGLFWNNKASKARAQWLKGKVLNDEFRESQGQVTFNLEATPWFLSKKVPWSDSVLTKLLQRLCGDQSGSGARFKTGKLCRLF